MDPRWSGFGNWINAGHTHLSFDELSTNRALASGNFRFGRLTAAIWAQLEFAHQTALVNTFDQTGPLQSVNFNGRTDRHAAQLVSFAVRRMRADSYTKETKETKNFVAAPIEGSFIFQLPNGPGLVLMLAIQLT